MALYSDLSVTTLQTYLTEAETAYHALSIGKKVVSLSSANGERIAFTPTEIPRLRAYVNELRRAIAIKNGSTISSHSVATWTR